MIRTDVSQEIAARFPFGIFEEWETVWSCDGVEGFISPNRPELRDPFTLFSPEKKYRYSGGMEIPSFTLKDIVGLEAISTNDIYDHEHGVKLIFDTHAVDLEIDSHWVRRLRQYVYGFYTRNADHTEFFGSPYLGTHRIIYKTSDSKEWFSNILDIDEVIVRDELIKCKYINKEFKVSSNVFNLSIPYLMYKVQSSKHLSSSQKEDALINLVIMFHYRIMTSIMSHYFGYLAKKKIAEAAYNALTLKFDIKRYGSWNALFKARAESIIDSKRGIHYETFTRLDNDKNIVYMVNDMESRLKGVINDYTRVFYKIKDNEKFIESDDGFVLLDGQLVVKDIQKNINQHRTFLEATLTSNMFYKEELADYAIKGMDRTPGDKFKQVVKEFPYAYNNNKGIKFREFVEDTVTHMFEYIAMNNIKQSDVRNVVVKLRGAYSSNKSTNALLFKLRDNGDKIISDMTGIKTRSTVTSMRTSLMLYIVIRTITMDAFR